MIISGKTKILGLFGYPVEHTMSPAMHNEACNAIGIDYCYLPFPVKPENLKDAVAAIRALHFSGVNVTLPHKEKVMDYLDEINEEAALIGAVNTVVNQEGNLFGYNTDGKGFIKSLEEEDISPKGITALLIGAGGASRAIAFSLALNGAEKIAVFDIDNKKAEELADAVSKADVQCHIALGTTASLKDYRIVINATPLGLNDNDPLPFSPQHMTSENIVYDVIYTKTKLLREAEKNGVKCIGGAGMLLWQGAIAFELWTGKEAPIEIMRKALYQGLGIESD